LRQESVALYTYYMNLFDSLKDIITNGVDLPADLPVVGDIQDQIAGISEGVSGITEGLTDQAAGVVEQGQTIVEDITNQLGL